MNLVNEVVDRLLNLSALVEDSKAGMAGGILSIHYNGDLANVRLAAREFFEQFRPVYDVKKIIEVRSSEPYYCLENEVEGVRFYAMFDEEQLSFYKQSHLEHYRHIFEELERGDSYDAKTSSVVLENRH